MTRPCRTRHPLKANDRIRRAFRPGDHFLATPRPGGRCRSGQDREPYSITAAWASPPAAWRCGGFMKASSGTAQSVMIIISLKSST